MDFIHVTFTSQETFTVQPTAWMHVLLKTKSLSPRTTPSRAESDGACICIANSYWHQEQIKLDSEPRE